MMMITHRTRCGAALAIGIGALIFTGATSGVQAAPAAKPVTATVNSALQWGPCPPIFPAGCQIAVLNGDPAKTNADVFLRVPGGYTIPPHSHTSPERIVLVEGQLSLRYQGSSAEDVTPGEYAYGPGGLPHVATCKGAGPCTLFIAFEGPVDAIAFTGALK
jgi:quercetin dioxygenase-like cupin family protein